MHLSIFCGHLQGGCSSSGQRQAIPPHPEPVAVLHVVALKINYSVEVRGGKTKADPSVSGRVDSAAVQQVNGVAVASITEAATA